MLEIVDLTAGYGERPVLDGVSLTVGDGEVVALLGPSGQRQEHAAARRSPGSSRPTAGHVRLDGVDITDVPTHRRGVGMVFQDEQLFPHRDVAANVAFGLRMQGPRTGAHVTRGSPRCSTSSGSPASSTAPVTELSGGEAKRVALARSLAPSPRALLLDEPLTGLDRELHDRLAVEVGRILRDAATTALLVTHDRAEAEAVADRVVTIDELGGTGISVVELATGDTYDLRRRVLRTGTPSTDVSFDGDDDPATTAPRPRRPPRRRRRHLLVDRRSRARSPRPTATSSCAAWPSIPTDSGRGLGAVLLAAGRRASLRRRRRDGVGERP